MKAEFKLTRPDDAEAKMTITATIHQWKNIKQSLEKMTYHSDAAAFSYMVRDLIEKAESEFASSGDSVSS